MLILLIFLSCLLITSQCYCDDNNEKAFYPFMQGDKWGYINQQGEIVVEPCYEAVLPFREGLGSVKLNREWGFIDVTGKMVIEPISASATYFSDGYARIKLGPGDIFIDKNGKKLGNKVYLYSAQFNEGLACVETDESNLFGFIDTKGEMVIQPRFHWANSFLEGRAAVNEKYMYNCWFLPTKFKYGYIDQTGRYVIPPRYEDAEYFYEGLARVEIDNKYGFIDRDGRQVIDFIYDDAAYGFSEGLAYVEINGKYGYINKKGKIVIPAIYDRVKDFREGLASVAIEDGNGQLRWGFINMAGETVIELQYENIWPLPHGFQNGLAYVKIDGIYIYIDKTGQCVFDPRKQQSNKNHF